MQLSAEIRWFWKDHPSAGLWDWFADPDRHLGPLAPAAVRIDRYLSTSSPELGIKLRGDTGLFEIKGLVSIDNQSGHFQYSIEIWSKWTCNLLGLQDVRTHAVHKKRWQRLFDTTAGSSREVSLLHRPAGKVPVPQLSRGCSVELTEISLGNETWWTFAFEAFGEYDTIAIDLRTTADEQLARYLPPLSDGLQLSYPGWLQAIS